MNTRSRHEAHIALVWKQVCPESGVLSVPQCPSPYREVFLENHEPVETCPLHGEGRNPDLWDDSSFEALDRQARERAGRELRGG